MLTFVGSACSRTQSKWNGFACCAEALAILIVAAVLLQWRFSFVVPRLALFLSKGVSLLHSNIYKPENDNEVKKVKHLSDLSLAAADENLDWEPTRRRIRSAYQEQILNAVLANQRAVFGLKTTEAYVTTSRGTELFTKTWIPETGRPKGLICFCHGYGDTCTYFFEGIARRLAVRNFAVLGMDYVGFGLSSGLHGYIPSFDLLVDDVVEHYSALKNRQEFEGLPCFLIGESMGGAVALKAHLKKPEVWDGAILVAPMCKIAEDMYPPRIVVEFLKLMSFIIPRAKLVPSKDIAEIGFRHVEKRALALKNVVAYRGKPRLGTALSLLRATDEIESQLRKVSLPLLILHGAEDRVTDMAVSQTLYKEASSADKTLYLYKNSWHALLEGEPDDTVDEVMDDIFTWLNARCASHQ